MTTNPYRPPRNRSAAAGHSDEDLAPGMSSVRFPTLIRRYLSTWIDAWLLLLLIVLVSVTPLSEDARVWARVAVVVAYILLYEPILSARSFTLGQLLTRIRVRQDNDPNARISIPRSYLRYCIKIVLGAASLITVLFSARSRAIHDQIADSMVIRV